MELYFRILPLCNSEARIFAADLKFDSSYLQLYRIGQLYHNLSIWPYIFKRNDVDSTNACANKICKDIEQFLFPFFFSCDNCCNIYSNYPNYKWFSDLSQEWVYFSLKANHLEIAIDTLQRHLQQREDARRINMQHIPDYDKSPAYLSSVEWDRRDREQIGFLKTATENEIRKYLYKKEETSRQAIESLLFLPK